MVRLIRLPKQCYSITALARKETSRGDLFFKQTTCANLPPLNFSVSKVPDKLTASYSFKMFMYTVR